MATIQHLVGTNKIKDEWQKINANFDALNAHVTRTDNPHGTTAEQVGAPSLTTTIPSGVSLNTVVTSGFYRLSDSHPDAPPSTSHGQMIVSRGGDTVLQIVTGFDYSHFYMRHGNPPEAGGSGVWQPWRELWHGGNNPANVAASGYHKLASGFIWQWGSADIPQAGGGITFPIAFPNALAGVFPVVVDTDPHLVSIYNPTLIGCGILHDSGSTKTVYWFAVGW